MGEKKCSGIINEPLKSDKSKGPRDREGFIETYKYIGISGGNIDSSAFLFLSPAPDIRDFFQAGY